MKLVERGEVLGLADYETLRERFRARVIDEKKRRRVALGPTASCLFENHDTVLLQIQEMLRTERITRESSVMHEIETYNQLVPADRELSATILVEIPEKEERDAFLVQAAGLERSFAVIVDGERFRGKPDESRVDAGRTTAVHYIKFPLSQAAVDAICARGERRAKVEVAAEHPRYTARTALPAELVHLLAEDLAG